VAGTDGGLIVLWEAETGKELRGSEATRWHGLADVHARRQVLASGGWDNSVGLWDAEDSASSAG
jgi:WD40 repeat protein